MIEKIKKLLTGGETRAYLSKTFFVYGFIALSIIVMKILIARLYGQEALGIFTYFFSLVSLAFLFTSFGIPEALTQIIIKTPEKLKSGIRYSLLLSIPLTILFIGITILVTSYIKINPDLPYFNLAFALYIITYSLHYFTYSILRGYKKFVSASIYSLLNRLFFITFAIGLGLYLSEFINVLFALSLSLFLATLISLPEIGKWKIPKQVSLDFKKFIYLAFSLFLMQVSFYSLRFVDALMITYLVDLSSLGLYSAFGSVTNTIRLLGYVFPMVVVPMAAISKFKLKESLRKIMKLLIPFSLLVLGGSYFVVPLFYGVEYSAPYLPIFLVISSTLLIIYSYFNSIFVGENEFSPFYLKILLADFGLSLILNTILNYAFISTFGIIGAPVATAITIAVKIWLNVWGIHKLRIQSSG